MMRACYHPAPDDLYDDCTWWARVGISRCPRRENRVDWTADVMTC